MIFNPFKKMDVDRFKRSSNLLRQSKDRTKVVNTRLKICALVVVLIFIIIAFRLVNLTVINKEDYQQKLTNYTAKKQSFSSPRGTIYDKNGKILVQSVSSLTISYYPIDSVSEIDEWKLAEKLVDDLNLKATNIIDRQLKDMYIQYMANVEKDNLNSLLSKADQKKVEEGLINSDERNDLLLEKIDVTQFDERTRAIYQVKMRMDAAPDSQYKVIVEDATTEQISYISENSTRFPGFKSTFDWKREYSEGNNLRSILGNVSTQTQGVPEEDQEYYLALDYSLNDRVGISGLEKQYENLLSGTKSLYNIKFDDKGTAYLEEEESGKNGYDLTLTLDIDYQNKMDELVKSTLASAQGNQYRQYFEKLQLVVMNPKTGEIYAMSAASKDSDGNIVLTPTDTYLSADRVGSVVKMATLYMGLNEGVVNPGEVIVDAPMKFKGTKAMQSYHNYGPLTDVQAIAQSSNVYMWNIALRLGGNNYKENMSISLKEGTFSLMRRYYNMFGLGVKTGIDLPSESVGSIGADAEQANILHFAIGQYDTYTTMQLAQYVATIANNGSRIQPHLLKYANEVNDRNTIVYKKGKNVISTLLGDLNYLRNPKQGMVDCAANSNYCGSPLSSANTGVNMAAKTGTAENELYINGELINTTNATMVAYGPSEDAEIAIACFAPNSNNGFGGSLQANICADVVGAAAKEYFKK